MNKIFMTLPFPFQQNFLETKFYPPVMWSMMKIMLYL